MWHPCLVTQDHTQTALDNVVGTEDVVRTIAKFGATAKQSMPRLILTSSMAAVRGNNQTPKSGFCYTHEDWNSVSSLGVNWGQSYQWSKAESERRAWDLARDMGVPMTSLCPSFVFGPPLGDTNSYSVELVKQWIKGESQVQSRLCVDVRDVAKAHVKCALNPKTIGNRYIASTESRIPSKSTAQALIASMTQENLGDPTKVTCDEDFDGGFIKIGSRECVAKDRMQRDVGVVFRPVEETMADMGRVLLRQMEMD